jgi:hypothetical protein
MFIRHAAINLKVLNLLFPVDIQIIHMFDLVYKSYDVPCNAPQCMDAFYIKAGLKWKKNKEGTNFLLFKK